MTTDELLAETKKLSELSPDDLKKLIEYLKGLTK